MTGVVERVCEVVEDGEEDEVAGGDKGGAGLREGEEGERREWVGSGEWIDLIECEEETGEMVTEDGVETFERVCVGE